MNLIAKFTPQAWVRGYAVEVDPEGPTEWDVTKHLRSLSESDAARAMETDTWESDELRDVPGAPQWVKDWPGPFYVEVEER